MKNIWCKITIFIISLSFVIPVHVFGQIAFNFESQKTFNKKVSGTVNVTFVYFSNTKVKQPEGETGFKTVDLNDAKDPKVKIVINDLKFDRKKDAERFYVNVSMVKVKGLTFEKITQGGKQKSDANVAQKTHSPVSQAGTQVGILYKVNNRTEDLDITMVYKLSFKDSKSKHENLYDLKHTFKVIGKKPIIEPESEKEPLNEVILSNNTDSEHQYELFINNSSNVKQGNCSNVIANGQDILRLYGEDFNPLQKEKILFSMAKCTWNEEGYKAILNEYKNYDFPNNRLSTLIGFQKDRFKGYSPKKAIKKTTKPERKPPEKPPFIVVQESEKDLGNSKMYTFTFKNHNSHNPKVDVLGIDDFTGSWDDRGKYVFIVAKDSDCANLVFKPLDNKSKSLSICPKNKSLTGQIRFFNADKNQVNITSLSNGSPPYYLSLRNVEYDIASKYEIAPPYNNRVLNINDYPIEIAGLHQIMIVDKTGIQHGQLILDELVDLKPQSSYFIWFTLAIAVVLAMLGYWGFKKYQEKRGKVSESFKEKLAQTKKGSNEKALKEGITVGVKQKNKPNIDTRSKGLAKGGVVVTGLKESSINSNKSLKGLLENVDDYFAVDATEMWDDTTIDLIFLSKKAIAQISDFVFTQNKLLHLKQAVIPEIGGFLIGKYAFDEKTKKYQLAVEEFVDVEPKNHNVYQITFGAKAWGWLDTRLNATEAKGYELIGWFHTHPGHGLFLSSQDINLHYTSFGKPFHFAMEMDSVVDDGNENFITAFFTSKAKKEEMNNKEDAKLKWHEWKDIEAWIRS